MIHKDKEIIVFEKPKTIEDVLDHFKKLDKRQIHTLFTTFACDMKIHDQLQLIFEDKLIKSQDTLKRLKITFDATPLSQKDFIALNQFLSKMKFLRHLELSFSFCNIDLPSIISLVEGIVSLSELKGLTLDLTGNSVLSNQHKLLSDLWRMPSKYFQLILCQCNISKFEYTLDSHFDKPSYALNKECASSIQQENQKQQNQYFQQQHLQQTNESKGKRVSQLTPKKEETSFDGIDTQNGNFFGIIDQKSDNSTSNPYLQFGDQEKQDFLNIQKESNNETKKAITTRSRKTNVNSDNKENHQYQQKRTKSGYNGIISQGFEGDSTGISINSHTKPSENIEDVDADEQNDIQEEYRDERNQKIKQMFCLYNGVSDEEERIYQNGKSNNLKCQNTQEDESKFKEEQDGENEDISDNNIEEDENDEVNDEDDEDYQDKLNNSKKQKNNKKKGSNIKTRSTKKYCETKKKQGTINKAITKKKIGLQKNNIVKKISQTKKNEDQQESPLFMKKEVLQFHSKTAGKGEAYLKRTQSNKSNSGNSIKNITEDDKMISEADQNMGQALNSQSDVLQNNQSSNIKSNDYVSLTQQSQHKIEISQFQSQYDCSFQQMIENKNEKGMFSSPIFQNQQQQNNKKKQKRTIDKVVLDLRENPKLQEQTLMIIDNALQNTYKQINFFHLLAPPNKWSDLSTLNFALIPNVLDFKLDPYGLQKIVFSNTIKSISTALRKFKFSQRLKEIPNTLQINEEIQNWFCPEKDYLNQQEFICDQCNENQFIRNKEQYEEDNQRYQEFFFSSQIHQICPVCKNIANQQHFLQANTEELYFSYSQKQIDIKDFSLLLEKVAFNIYNQFSQIFNDGFIKENGQTSNSQNLINTQLIKNNQNLKQNDITPLNSPPPSCSNQRQILSILSSPEQKNLNITRQDTIDSCQTPVQNSQIILNTQNSQNTENIQNNNQTLLLYTSQYQDQQYFNSPQLTPFQLATPSKISSSFHDNQHKLNQFNINNICNSQKQNNFQKKLERVLKIKQIESVNISLQFKDYYYELQYELVQRIFNIIKVISERAYIYKLYLCISKGISPLIIAQILFIQELFIDKIEAGCCHKDGNIFFINLSNPKFQIRREDLQIFAQIINQNTFFEEIHINFDISQNKCIQSISHLLTRYKQTINYKDNILIIYRGNTLPLFQQSQSTYDYIEMMDEFGNFHDSELDSLTPQLQLEPKKKSIKQADQKVKKSKKDLILNSLEQQKHDKTTNVDSMEQSQSKMEQENLEQANKEEENIINKKDQDKKAKPVKKRQSKKEKNQEEQENGIASVPKKKYNYKKKNKQQENEQEVNQIETPKKKNSQKQKNNSKQRNKKKANQVEIIQNQYNNDNIFSNESDHKEQYSNDQLIAKQNSQIESNEQGNQNDDNINNSNTFEDQSYPISRNLYQKQNQNSQELLY